MLVHCISIADGGVNALTSEFRTLCGAPALHSSHVSDVAEQISCEDCILRLLARTHSDLAVLLKQLGLRIIALRKQAEQAVARD